MPCAFRSSQLPLDGQGGNDTQPPWKTLGASEHCFCPASPHYAARSWGHLKRTIKIWHRWVGPGWEGCAKEE